MPSRQSSLLSTVATKILIALTGLSLGLFLCVHLFGNLLLYVGPEAFNAWGHALVSNPFVIPAEIGIALLIVIHVLQTVTMWWTNRGARPVAYTKKAWAGGKSRKSVGSSTMIWTGLTMFVFIAVHVATMKYGKEYSTELHGVAARDLDRLVREFFGDWRWVAFYVPCVGVTGFHLWHGFASGFESLGLNHPNLTPRVLKIGRVLAFIIGAGFVSIPLVLFFLRSRS